MSVDTAVSVGRCAAAPGPYQFKSGTLSSHGRILAVLERLGSSRRVLDVGTATGYLGGALRQRGFRRVFGIEQHSAWAAEARTLYDRVVEANVEHDPLPWPPESFDVIICADVLEHVRHPEQVLQRLLPLITPAGWVIISLPNVAHWSVRMNLLFGRFEYVDSGILDREHLRFFTRRTARRLIDEVGLALHSEIPIPLPIVRWCNAAPRLSLLWGLLERMDWCLGQLCPTLFAYQFVFVAQKPGAPSERPHD